MEKLFDEKVKKLFKTLKALMFWPHPEEYKKYMVAFNMRENELIEEFKSIPEEKIKDMAEELNSSIQDFPLSIYVETTSRCNLRCVMCPHKSSQRDKGEMSKEMFLKIVDEVAEKNPSITFSPFYFGEPLMDKNLFEKIIYCKKKGLTHIKLSTNGSLFSVNDNYKKLVDCGVDHLVISFDGITKKTYESIRIGSKFKNFMDGVNKLMEYKKDRGSSMRITGQMINMDYNSSHKKEFIKYCEEKELEPYFASFQFWGQLVKGVEGLEKLRYPCNNPLYSAVILHNGDLVACCMDFEGKCVFGNLKENTLEDLWKKKHKLLRQAQINGEYTKFPVCDGCSDWMSFGYNRFAKIIG